MLHVVSNIYNSPEFLLNRTPLIALLVMEIAEESFSY